MPTFSILIAIYNAAPWLDACLDSLAAQTFTDFQAICVDDCSTDESASIVARRCAQDARFVSLRTTENRGQAAARNLAVAHAKGTYTLFLDADDRLAPDALMRLATAFREGEDVDAAVLRLVRTWSDGREEEVPVRTGRHTLFGREACLLSIDWRLHGVYALRTDIQRRHLYFTSPRRYADDNTTLLHYLACRRVVLTSATYYYRQHPESCTHVGGMARLDALEAGIQRRHLLEEANIGREGLRHCERYCWYNFVALHHALLASPSALSVTERREAHRRFAHALAAMHPSRLSISILRHPSTVFVRPYRLFCWWQTLIGWFKPKR